MNNIYFQFLKNERIVCCSSKGCSVKSAFKVYVDNKYTENIKTSIHCEVGDIYFFHVILFQKLEDFPVDYHCLGKIFFVYQLKSILIELKKA